MKKIIITLLLLSPFLTLYGNNNDSIKYIIISRLGITNYSFPSLILSVDSITNIKYADNNFEEMIKYKHYDNIIISFNLMRQLYNFLKLTRIHNERQKGFSKKDLLIIDYNINNKDYELITGSSLEFTLFVLKTIYCIINNEDKNNEYLLSKISDLYYLYVKSYNSEDYYFSKINDCY